MARPRVIIRKPERGDCEAFLAAMKASAGLHRPWVQPPLTPAEFERFITRIDGEQYDSRLVCLPGGEIAGVINVNNIIRGTFHSAFLGYFAVAGHAGNGLMTAGLRLVLRHAFEGLKLHRLEANIQPGNRASIALVRRCGFTREGFSPRYLKIAGRWRDHERWALTAEGWRGSVRETAVPISRRA